MYDWYTEVIFFSDWYTVESLNMTDILLKDGIGKNVYDWYAYKGLYMTDIFLKDCEVLIYCWKYFERYFVENCIWMI